MLVVARMLRSPHINTRILTYSSTERQYPRKGKLSDPDRARMLTLSLDCQRHERQLINLR